MKVPVCRHLFIILSMKKYAIICFAMLLAACNRNENTSNEKPQQKTEIAGLQPDNIGADSADMASFMKLSGFNYFKLKIPEAFATDSLTFYVRQFYKGQVVDSSHIGDEISLLKSPWLRCYTSHLNEKIEVFSVAEILPLELEYYFELKTEQSKYRWTQLYDLRKPTPITMGEEIALFTFGTAPMEDGKCVYCQLPDSHNYRDWYTQFNMDHYWVISIKFSPGSLDQETIAKQVVKH